MTAMNMTKLQGVNRILRAAREHAVSSLGDATQNDTLLAEQILDDILMREQMSGLHVNTTEASFDRDSVDFKVRLPSNTLAVKGWNQDVNRNYGHREQAGEVLLVDFAEQPATTNFGDDGAETTTAYVRITWCMEFEDLPIQHQMSIVDQSAVEYQESVLGDPQLGSKLEARAGRSRANSRRYDMAQRPSNQFCHGRSQGPRLGRGVFRSWPYNDLKRQ